MIFTPKEIERIKDKDFFPDKATISKKIRQNLERLHESYQQEIRQHQLITPDDFRPHAFQFVKGENLENFPYQYLDYPRFYTREIKVAFRTLFWWGHHITFALILEGGNIRRYKENLINRFSEIAGQEICLCLDNSLWEWKYGSGYTLELTQDRKPELAAVLANRPFFKLARFVNFDAPILAADTFYQQGQETLRTLLLVITE